MVTKDTPPYAIVAGNPAKIIRYRFSEAQIKDLLEIRWWDMDMEVIQKCIGLLLSDKIDLFIQVMKAVRAKLDKEQES